MSMIALQIHDCKTGETSRYAMQLPVKIGRGTGCDVQLPAENRAVSRTHLEIVEERGRTTLYNRASNLEATQFMGRWLMPDERVEVVPGDEIGVFDTVITMLAPAKIGILVARRLDLKPIGDYRLLPGGAILAHETDGVVTVEPIPDITQLATGHLTDRLAVLFYYDDEQPTFAVISNPDALPVLLDRGLVEQPALYIHAEDTIEVGSSRFEVMAVGEASIVCENLECQVLNAHDRGENCRICGAQLFGATRILRIRKL